MDGPQLVCTTQYQSRVSESCTDRLRQGFITVNMPKVTEDEDKLTGKESYGENSHFNHPLEQVPWGNMPNGRKEPDCGTLAVEGREVLDPDNTNRPGCAASWSSPEGDPKTPPSNGRRSEEELRHKDCAMPNKWKPGFLCHTTPTSQFMQSYIYNKYRQQGYKHDFEPSMIHPDPVPRRFTQVGPEEGQFDDVDD